VSGFDDLDEALAFLRFKHGIALSRETVALAMLSGGIPF
jgi:hypothetical protein